jgi:hypothetical protein
MGRKWSEPLEFVGFRRNYHANFGSSSGKSGIKRPTIPEGNGARARVLFDELMNHRQRVLSKERAM